MGLLFLLGWPSPPVLSAQASVGAASSRVAPGPQYRAGAINRAFLGGGWRDLWTQELRLPVADLDTLEGGLQILRLSGGTTSATLHVQSADGRRFVFRTVDKDPLTGQLEELTATVFGTTLQDQISAFNPLGAPVVARLLEAVGVIHAKPQLYTFPFDVAVPGEADRFAGKVVLFEERPEELPDGRPGMGGFTRFAGTESILGRTRASSRHRIQTADLLTARLVDLVVGDRDRAIGNWRWAAVAGTEPTVWHPIPRDRDQAFVQMDGGIKRLLRLWEPRLVRFDDTTPSVEGLSRNAWDLDRRYLTQLSRAQWDSVTFLVREALHDDILREAVLLLPPEGYALSGERTFQILRRRRDALPRMAREFFALVNTEADVWGTNASDSLHVSRSTTGGTEVRLFVRGGPSEPYWHRTFEAGAAKEIRVYLLDEDDTSVVTGFADGVRVQIVGGAGADDLVAAQRVGTVEFLDAGGKTSTRGIGAIHRRSLTVPAPVAWGDSATVRHFGSTTVPVGVLRYSSDIGLVIGGGFQQQSYGLFKRPYESQWQVRGGFAFGRNRGLVRLERRSVLGAAGPGVSVYAQYSGVERLRYYGYGNSTEVEGPSDQFLVLHDRAEVGLTVTDTTRGSLTWAAGPVFGVMDTDTTGLATILAVDRPYGSGDFSQLGIEAGIRRCPTGPSLGFRVRGQPIRCADPNLGSIWTAAAKAGAYVPVGSGSSGTFAVFEGRLAGQRRLGERLAIAGKVGLRTSSQKTPFHQAAYLGGTSTLRGYAFDRFVGDHAVFMSTEVRSWIATIHTSWFPMDVGLIGLVDTGRVWSRPDNSTTWHTSWGGGVWIAPFKRGYTLHAVVARSSEGTTFHMGPSFGF